MVEYTSSPVTSRVIGLPGHDLILLLVRRQVRADHLPRHAVVGRAVQDVRRLIDGLRIVRREHDDGLARKPELDVVGMMTVAILRIDPAALRLAGLDVEALDLTLARAPDRRGRRASARCRRSRSPTPASRPAPDDRSRRPPVGTLGTTTVELSCCGRVEQVRMLLVDRDHVELGGRLVEDARPRAAAVGRDVRAAVVRLDRVGGIVGVEPDAVVVGVRRRDRAERDAAVAGAQQRQRAHPHVVRRPSGLTST